MGEQAKTIRIEDICKACGVDSIKIGDPAKTNELASLIEEALRSDSISVVISRRICAQVLLRERRRKGETVKDYNIDIERCSGCETCITLGCPAISFDVDQRKAEIYSSLCQGCGICAQICPVGAISK
jgi:indolepyruvate ferredoxin oxidoreductase alpha subunit